MLDNPEGKRRGKCGYPRLGIPDGCTDNQIDKGKSLPAGAHGLKDETIGKTAYGARVKNLGGNGQEFV